MLKVATFYLEWVPQAMSPHPQTCSKSRLVHINPTVVARGGYDNKGLTLIHLLGSEGILETEVKTPNITKDVPMALTAQKKFRGLGSCETRIKEEDQIYGNYILVI